MVDCLIAPLSEVCVAALVVVDESARLLRDPVEEDDNVVRTAVVPAPLVLV